MTNVKKGKVKHMPIMEGDAKQDCLHQRSLKHFKMEDIFTSRCGRNRYILVSNFWIRSQKQLDPFLPRFTSPNLLSQSTFLFPPNKKLIFGEIDAKGSCIVDSWNPRWHTENKAFKWQLAYWIVDSRLLFSLSQECTSIQVRSLARKH